MTILEWISLRSDAAVASNLKQNIEKHLNITSANLYADEVN